MSYCCKMREKYLLGIVSENLSVPTPTDVVDFTDFDAKTSDGRSVLRIKFCPFCGRPVEGPLIPHEDGRAKGELLGTVVLDARSVAEFREAIPGRAAFEAALAAAGVNGCAAWAANAAQEVIRRAAADRAPLPLGFVLRIKPADPVDLERWDRPEGGPGGPRT